MKRSLLLMLACLAAGMPGVGFSQTVAPELPFNPKDGETVVFLGDSITHQCLYTQYLEDFFYSRYPERHLHFHNAGVSGDKAADALARFEDDVAALKPNYVTVLLGMNDGKYEDFNAETFDTYQKDMKTLLDKIQAIGAKAIVLSPTMFDYGAHVRRSQDPTFRFRDRPRSPLYNAVLAFYGGWCLEEAGRRGTPFVDLWAPMNTLAVAERRHDPTFTLTPDAIHPSPAGQVVMAYEVLWQLGAERRNVSNISLVNRGKTFAGTKVQELVASEDGAQVSFSYTPPALPWVIPAAASGQETKWDNPNDGRLGYTLTHAGHHLSGQVVKISGLAPGSYEVLMDGKSIGKWNNITLGTKIEIQENAASAEYEQGLAVSELNRERNDKAVRPLRDLWSQVKGLRGKNAQDPAAFEAAYAALKPRIEELRKLAADYEQKIYAVAQPKPCRFEIRPAAAIGKP